MLVAVSILCAAIALLLSWWFYNYYHYEKYMAKYDGPRPLPLLGSAHEFANSTEILPQMLKFMDKHGPNYKIILGSFYHFVVGDFKTMEYVLSSTKILEKSYEYKLFHSWLGSGLLTSTREKWKKQRKLLTPSFHFQILQQFLGTFDTNSDILVKQLSKEVGNEGFDIFPYVTLCALDIICEASMGTSVNAQINSDSEYVKSVQTLTQIIVRRVFSPIKINNFLYKFSRDYQKEIKALKVLHGYSNSVIIKRRGQLLAKQSDTSNIEENDGRKTRTTFLDLLLQSNIDGNCLSDENIREEVDTFMFEGHDTTTSAISFILYMLSKHADVQDKVVDELKAVFVADKTKPASYEDLQEMKYLELVIKETLRLYPSVPIFGRVLEEDVELDGGVLPKGLVFTLFVFGLQRQASIFPNPEKFDPERFRLQNTLGRSPYSYVPFSAGPRNCIGQRFAMLEMKSTVSKVLRNYELLPAIPTHEPILAFEIILKSHNGLPIRLKKRNF